MHIFAKNKNMERLTRIFSLAAVMTCLLASCSSRPENPYEPDVEINIRIEPNSMQYFDLNVVSGWMYVTAPYPSRGVIIYRYSQDEFRAYERTPPNSPDACGEPNALTVESPFVVDGCTDFIYNILDGSIVEGGDGYPLIQYYTQYDGTTLRVYN